MTIAYSLYLEHVMTGPDGRFNALLMIISTMPTSLVFSVAPDPIAAHVALGYIICFTAGTFQAWLLWRIIRGRAK
jgi:hypothetical protein